MSQLTPEEEAHFNAALLAMLVERLGGEVIIDAEAFDAFIERDIHLDTVGTETEITLTLNTGSE
jgi:hypothetical protein